jgi:hypothetical protein
MFSPRKPIGDLSERETLCPRALPLILKRLERFEPLERFDHPELVSGFSDFLLAPTRYL